MRNETLLREAAEAIARAGELDLACHVGPDGDALGSMLGLGIAARNAGKTVRASYGSPFGGSTNLDFLPFDLLVPPGKIREAPELMVVLDVGSADRLGELAANAGRAEKVVVLDHHVTNDGFGDVAVIDPSAAATGELVFDLLGILGWEITTEIAQCLHTALVTDTGRFTYSNTTERTLEIAARLLAAGANPTDIARHVYEETPFGYLKAAAAALGRAELDEEKGVVSTYVTQTDLTNAGIDWGGIDNLIDTVRLAQEADVAVLAKVHADGKVKISMRSRGATDVGSLATAMGGGGHRLAAGFTIDKKTKDVIAEIIRKVEDYR